MIKRFLKFVFKNTIIAVASTLLSFVLILIILVAIVGSIASKTEPFPSKAILSVNLTMNLVDTPPSLDFEEIIKQVLDDAPVPEYGLRDVAETLRRAKDDRRIKGIYLHGSFRPSGYGCSYPVLQEFRSALEDFKSSGKLIIAYSVNPSLRDMYVMSTADEFYLNKAGVIQIPGLYSERMFYANAMEKYGIGVQVVRVGEYKSAVEPYTRSSMSKEAKEASQMLLDELWTQILGSLASSRELDPFEINNHIQRNPIILAEKAVEMGLCDKAITHNEIITRLVEIAEKKTDDGTYARIAFGKYVLEKDRFASSPTRDGVAIVYAEGAIVGGQGEDDQAGADRIIMNLREARNNPSVKAIVLRVNSPGGGATASKIIQDELLEVKKQGLPLIVSMGGYAASGGYLISQSADHIFSHPHTITGSIGIFGLLFNVGEGAAKLGITFDEVKTTQNADILSVSKPKTPLQLQIIQNFLKEFYDDWLITVAEYRKKPLGEIQRIASGRVWSGYKADQLGLVDELGGLFDAISYAAKAADLEKYDVYDYPRKLSEEEALAEALGFGASVKKINSPIVSKLENWLKQSIQTLNQFDDPIGAYVLSPIRYE